MALHKFKDEQKRLADFDAEVWVVCPSCQKKAVATRNDEQRTARILCTDCGYNRTEDVSVPGTQQGMLKMAAHHYFKAGLWLTAPFRDDHFFALNGEHLNYLESYIGAGIRENRDRQFTTMVEKLPKFMQVAANRQALLKLIQKLRKK